MERIRRGREEANSKFRRKEFREASENYGHLLDEVELLLRESGDEVSGEAAGERTSILSNRAACWVQLGEWEKCVEDATRVLQLDDEHVKARFRRAQALEKLGRLRDSLDDLRVLLRQNPRNDAAQAAMRRVTAAYEADRGAQTRSVPDVLERLQAAVEGKSPLPSSEDGGPLLRDIRAVLQESASLSEFGRAGGFSLLLRWRPPGSPVPLAVLHLLHPLSERDDGVAVLAASVSGEEGGAIWGEERRRGDVLPPDATARLSFLADVAERLQWLYLRSLAARRAARARAAASPTPPPPPSSPVGEQEEVRSLLIPATTRVTDAALAVLRSPSGEQGWADALAALGHVCATRVVTDHVRAAGGLRAIWWHSVSATESVQAQARLSLTRALERLRHAREDESEGTEEALSRDNALKDAAKELCAPLRRHEGERGGGSKVQELEDEEEEVEGAASAVARGAEDVELADVARAGATALALFLVDRNLTLSLLSEEGAMQQIGRLAFSPEPSWQEVFAELCGYLANDSEGRGLLDGGAKTALSVLGDAVSDRVRSAATTALAKLVATTPPEQRPQAGAGGEGGGGGGGAMEGPSVSETLLALYEPLAEDIQSRVRGSRLAEGEAPSPSELGLLGRAIEALATLSSRAPVKRALARDHETLAALVELLAGLGRIAEKARKRAVGGEDEARAVASGLPPEWSSIALGVCFVLHMLTVSAEVQRARALARLEVTPREWDEFQRLTKGAASDEVEEDSREAVDARIRSLLQQRLLPALTLLARAASDLHEAVMSRTGRGPQGGTSSAVREAAAARDGFASRRWETVSASRVSQWQPLSEAEEARRRFDEQRNMGPGAATLQAVASALQNVSERPWARPQLVQGGAVPLLLRLANEQSGSTLEGRIVACQALAQVLMSTNPNMLPRAQIMDAVPPLLFLARGRGGLRAFEATVALTNIGSMDAETATRIVACRGLSALEGVQFSDNLLLRRAGTEALANLVVTPQGRALVLEERRDLWLALIRGYGEDRDTAIAAAGALAMAVGDDEDAARALMDSSNGLRSVASGIASGCQDLQHRLLVVLRAMCAVREGWRRVLEPIELGEASTEDDRGDREGEAGREEEEEGEGRGEESGRVAAGTESNTVSAEEALRAATALGPPAAGVQVAPLQLAFLLAQGQAFPDLSLEEEEEGVERTAEPLRPEVKALAEQVVEIVVRRQQER